MNTQCRCKCLFCETAKKENLVPDAHCHLGLQGCLE